MLSRVCFNFSSEGPVIFPIGFNRWSHCTKTRSCRNTWGAHSGGWTGRTAGHVCKEHDCQQGEDENEEFPGFDRCHDFLVVSISLQFIVDKGWKRLWGGDMTRRLPKQVTNIIYGYDHVQEIQWGHFVNIDLISFLLTCRDLPSDRGGCAAAGFCCCKWLPDPWWGSAGGEFRGGVPGIYGRDDDAGAVCSMTELVSTR